MKNVFTKEMLEKATLTAEQEGNAERHICPTCNMVSLLTQVVNEHMIAKKCYICHHVVILAPKEAAMKYKPNDRVHLTQLDKEGIVVNNEGTKLHPYYVSFDDNKDADYFAEADMTPSKIVLLTNEQIDSIILTLHNYGQEVQPHSFGLPIYNGVHMTGMREAVRKLLAPPAVLPDRREKTRIFTDLDKKIAEDAILFEEHLGVHPEREDCTTLPWGWRYTSQTIQKQFREYCNRDVKKEA